MRKIIKQIAGFVGLSGIGWILDFCTFIFLGNISDNLVLNNNVSSWVGVTFVFISATQRVFENNSRISLKYKYLIYIIYQFVLILIISRVLNAINIFLVTNINFMVVRNFSTVISKVLITPITLILNFVIMKGIIEKL